MSISFEEYFIELDLISQSTKEIASGFKDNQNVQKGKTNEKFMGYVFHKVPDDMYNDLLTRKKFVDYLKAKNLNPEKAIIYSEATWSFDARFIVPGVEDPIAVNAVELTPKIREPYEKVFGKFKDRWVVAFGVADKKGGVDAEIETGAGKQTMPRVVVFIAFLLRSSKIKNSILGFFPEKRNKDNEKISNGLNVRGRIYSSIAKIFGKEVKTVETPGGDTFFGIKV